ncbi:DEAD/DEAH box helicase [Rhodococcus sp. HNM0563]|uniref:DEAD/DEAH box helicase n=1 Tax=Rhodococcus sp. HNM0563 TaxID=2716339 RepID=UPI00146A691E|nr:DEAD/DEAH box helicase [Rhodococcus sp. HNM0563]NLU64271.1 DEAD/DEAH box helicase [Rhodococcus sp. HNM0563]
MTARLDPLVTGAQIEAAYKRYLKTMVAPSDSAMAATFEDTIDDTDFLTKGPILELTPPYKAGASLRDLVNEGILHPDFVTIDSAALPIDRPLYQHQESAIRKVVSGRNLVVSTGTGSGKTESFLLPILNSLIAEKAAGTLGPGVRALLLYPMNALANDQLSRLRTILAEHPDITFGRYTGETIEQERDAVRDFLASNSRKPRLPNELLSRDEMRERPPHILLTNYAMLEYLLVRPLDLELFDGQYAGNWKFIALDEAHVYDGAQGSEVALLLRRLRQRVAPGTSLQCIATSASLDGERAEAMTFASKLFQADFEYVAEDSDRQDLVTATRQTSRTSPTWTMSDEELFRWSADGADLSDLAARSRSGDAADALHDEKTIADLRARLSAGADKPKPRDARELAADLWPDDPNACIKLEALVALGSKIIDDTGNPVLSARYHMFVRATEGAFVSFADAGPRIFLGRREVDPETGRAVFEFGTCQRCGAVHLAGEVTQVKGQQYFAPSKTSDESVRWLVLSDGAADVTVDEDEQTLSDEKPSDDPSVRYLCTCCGLLADTGGQCTNVTCVGGTVRRVRQHTAPTSVMSKCTECGAQSRQVIRRLRTDVNAAPAVITTALYEQLPAATDETVQEVGDGRKLLAFSDSRQAAAFAAPYLERTYSRLLERRYINLALQEPKAEGKDISLRDVARFATKNAESAGHFDTDMTELEIEEFVNTWVMSEVMTTEHRQSLEGLGLMRVAMSRVDGSMPPKALAKIGLSVDEAWGLLDELLKTVRQQGAINLLDEVDVMDEHFAPRNVRIRLARIGSDPAKRVLSWLPSGRPGTTNNRVLFVQKVLESIGSPLSVQDVLDGCWDFFKANDLLVDESDKRASGVYQVNHRKLRVRNGLDCEWFRCDTCRRVTAFSVRSVCPNSACAGKLLPFEIPEVRQDSNHYRHLYRTLNTAPLTAMEHTAQWDSKKAAEIQNDFVAGKINVLSCSTTFELGVDVGDLQTVVMRNMPPKTANYVQRAGRAGRRAASAALVLTYATRSSHDLAKYQRPESMIAGNMRIPWIPIDNERIARRHAHSIALAAFFRHCYEVEKLTWKHAGPFFLQTEGADAPSTRVRSFLTPVPDDVRRALEQVIPETLRDALDLDGGKWVDELCALLDKAQGDLEVDVQTFESLIDDAVKSRKFGDANRLEKTVNTIRGRQLLGYLANKNILPKYGFPVDTVELQTVHCQEPIGTRLELSRDLRQAIYDYAPGNQVVAGGKVWRSRGIRKIPRYELEQREYRVCEKCKRFESALTLSAKEVCDGCGARLDMPRKFIVPEFGFVADRKATDVSTAPPERRWSGRSYVEDTGDVLSPFFWPSSENPRVCATPGTRATLAVVADGGGWKGFSVCDWCGWAAPRSESKGKKGSAHEQPMTGRACNGPMKILSLAHRYQTDIAEFTFEGLGYAGDDEGRWLSVLYALLEGASEALEISRDDIDGALSWDGRGHRSLVLFDTVPAGAGVAKRIAENLDRVLVAAAHRVANCDCGEETSCYGCLRSYRNARSHEQLSRRAALDVFTNAGMLVTDSESGVPALISDEWLTAIELADLEARPVLESLAKLGAPVPDIGAEVGPLYWPVEAFWATRKLAAVLDSDTERDEWLMANGCDVVAIVEVDAGELAVRLIGTT